MIIILHNIRSMHNVGSIFRTSDGAGCIEKIYLCGITPAPIDRFGRERQQITKVSLGAEKIITWKKVGKEHYSEQTVKHETQQSTSNVIDQLAKKGFRIIALEQHPQSVPYTDFRLTSSELRKTALILGNECEGIPENILERCHAILEIPMYGTKHSLNVSVAYAIIAYTLTLKQKNRPL